MTKAAKKLLPTSTPNLIVDCGDEDWDLEVAASPSAPYHFKPTPNLLYGFLKDTLDETGSYVAERRAEENLLEPQNIEIEEAVENVLIGGAIKNRSNKNIIKRSIF